MFRNTYAVINLKNIAQNIKNIKNNIGTSNVIAVVKADAYGHGANEVSKTALASGADFLAVALCEEAISLREQFLETKIFVMGKSNKEQIKLGVQLDLSMCVFGANDIYLINEIAKVHDKKASVHLKIDTGMCRIGIRTFEELEEILSAFKLCENVCFEGIFTHFSCSDDKNKAFTYSQHEKFTSFINEVKKNGYYPKIHCSNSGAAIDVPEFSYDNIRLGISMYGYYASKSVCRDKVKLFPAMEVISEVSNVKYIQKGDFVGYGATFVAKDTMKIATVQIGYGDGYNRLLSNKGKMIVKNEDSYAFANILGRVCMDQTLIDVTNIKKIEVGDKVVVMGKRGNLSFDADDIAKICDTISYEIVLSYNNRVPRVYV